MIRIVAGILALAFLVGMAPAPAHAERWLRVLEKDPHKNGPTYNWFDVDSVVHEKKSGLVLVHVGLLSVKAVKAGNVQNWTLWGVDCAGQKAYNLGATGSDGKVALNTSWKTDPRAVFPFTAQKPDPVVAALGSKVCAWLDAWPPGTMP